MNAEEKGTNCKVESVKAQRREDKMSVLHLIVPMFFAIQFVLVLLALVSAMLFADPQVSLPARKSSRR
jgi:hypothetical protein